MELLISKAIISVLLVIGIDLSLEKYQQKSKDFNPGAELVVTILEFILIVVVWSI